jgi:hypothetical protein
MQTKAVQLEGLPEWIIPIAPVAKSFSVSMNSQKLKMMRSQLPMTFMYAFTDYQSQGQIISPVLINIGPPPLGRLTPFNAYVTLLQGQSRKNIRLLWNFNNKIFTQYLSKFLRLEDERLDNMDRSTKQ